MPKDYSKTYILEEDAWNNALSYNLRKDKRGEKPKLFIPNEITWSLSDVREGDEVVFEEVEKWQLISSRWLKHFVRIENYQNTPPCIIFDNHNHALFYWLEAIREWKIKEGFELIHIDEHSDLWDNPHSLDKERAIRDSEYAWEFTNMLCNVGNYIVPAQKNGIIKNMIRIENESQIDAYTCYTPEKNSILNLDLDIFSPELAHIDQEKIVKCIRNFIPRVRLITIATSPYFINQERAIQKLQYLF